MVIDSYTEDNGGSFLPLTENPSQFGECFMGKSVNLTSVKFDVSYIYNPTGDLVVKVYGHTGDYGSGKPDGNLLATSDSVNITEINESVSHALVEFPFSGENIIPLVRGTPYCICIDTTGVTFGGELDGLLLLVDSSGEHPGSSFYGNGSTWSTYGNNDFIFYVYGEDPRLGNKSALPTFIQY